MNFLCEHFVSNEKLANIGIFSVSSIKGPTFYLCFIFHSQHDSSLLVPHNLRINPEQSSQNDQLSPACPWDHSLLTVSTATILAQPVSYSLSLPSVSPPHSSQCIFNLHTHRCVPITSTFGSSQWHSTTSVIKAKVPTKFVRPAQSGISLWMCLSSQCSHFCPRHMPSFITALILCLHAVMVYSSGSSVHISGPAVGLPWTFQSTGIFFHSLKQPIIIQLLTWSFDQSVFPLITLSMRTNQHLSHIGFLSLCLISNN